MQAHLMTVSMLVTVRIVPHRNVFAFITEVLGRQGVCVCGEWWNAQRPTVTSGWLAKECTPTYMPCLSTCRSHSEPSVNDRPQNSHGKRFSGAPLSGNIMGSGKRQHSSLIWKCQHKKGPLWPYSNPLCCTFSSLKGKRTYLSSNCVCENATPTKQSDTASDKFHSKF